MVRAAAVDPPMTEATVPRLDFDGGPWIGRFPLSATSPWAEVLLAAGAAWAVGMVLPDPGLIRSTGWFTWLILTPMGAVVSLVAWLLTGTWLWVPASAWLGPLGWGGLGAAVGDLIQGLLPLSFPARVVASVAAATAVVGMSGLIVLWVGS